MKVVMNMRRVESLKKKWKFTKTPMAKVKEKIEGCTWENIDLPHTWNAFDGQDGGADYHRGCCTYVKTMDFSKMEKDKKYFVEFQGANHVAKVYFNNEYLGIHKGGFSTFRFELTEYINWDGENILEVEVDNSEGLQVYPQQADFTFYGGIYRSVNLIMVEESHFDLEMSGSKGVFVTPVVEDLNSCELRIDAFVKGAKKGQQVKVTICDKENKEVISFMFPVEKGNGTTSIVNPHLWNGRKDPYLYLAIVELIEGEEVLDKLKITFGVRKYSVDPDQGFILNEVPYHLHGVARHQDRLDMGWAIGEKEHKEDMELIKEVGATTIRLAHYQHADYFYDLCDEAGMVLWAEIPFISVFMNTEEAKENTLSQMKELVVQNYNHPSICFWGISNEISVGGETPELENNLVELNSLCKKLDPNRITTIANMSMTPIDSNHNHITDIVSYNHYFGWYGGDVNQTATWYDMYHNANPSIPIAISEYGAEAVLTWHSDEPKCKDYTEEYQALYHEKMLEILEARPFIWASYMWNMFDFAADARKEGGVEGRNNKGLVTYGRDVKKDAFYAYKAYWSEEAFVHICSKRYVDRASDKINVKVYSNCKEVTLLVNGETFETKSAHKVFVFENVPLKDGENVIKAISGVCEDEATFVKVDKPNESYVLVEEDNGMEGVRNWFLDLLPEDTKPTELEFPEGYYSIKDTFEDILKNKEATDFVAKIMDVMIASKTDASEDMSDEEKLMMVRSLSVETIVDFLASKLPPDSKFIVNHTLNKIKK